MDQSTERQYSVRSTSGPATTAGGGSFKGLAIALALIVVLLSGALWVRHNNAAKQNKELQDKVKLLSDQVVQANTDLTEAKQVITGLEGQITAQSDAASRLSNTLS